MASNFYVTNLIRQFVSSLNCHAFLFSTVGRIVSLNIRTHINRLNSMVKNRLIINEILIVLLFRVILVLLVAAKDSITFCN